MSDTPSTSIDSPKSTLRWVIQIVFLVFLGLVGLALADFAPEGSPS